MDKGEHRGASSTRGGGQLVGGVGAAMFSATALEGKGKKKSAALRIY